MTGFFGITSGESTVLLASVLAFTSFFLVGRLVNARQGVAYAFAFTPLLLIFLVGYVVAVLS